MNDAPKIRDWLPEPVVDEILARLEAGVKKAHEWREIARQLRPRPPNESLLLPLEERQPNPADDILPPQIWAIIAGNQGFQKLRIDDFLRSRAKSRRPPIIKLEISSAKCAARRALEVAWIGVLQAQHELPGPIISDFEEGWAKAVAAEKALNDLILYLQPGAKRAQDLQLSILTAKIGPQTGSAIELHAKAERNALALWEAREFVKGLRETAFTRYRSTRKGRQNPGKPEHAAFLKPLAEIWIFLTGEQPGSTRNYSLNPFLQFAREAWKDVFGTEARPPDFLGALGQLPKLSDREVQELKESGPWSL